MADVAKLANVSHQTVSRVINGSTQVRPETRERVLAAMQKLEYRPNTMARALATGRSRTLGVVGFDTTLYGPATALFGINHAAHEEGYFISTVSMRTLDRDSILEAVERLRVQGVEGILVIAPQTDAAHAVLQLPDHLPVVAVQAGPDGGIPLVSGDPEAGAFEATEHLLQLGHGTVWHIAGPANWFEARQRVAGWQRALRAAGVEPPPALYGDWSPQSGYELGRRLAADARRDGDLRRQRPHGPRGAPRAARSRPRRFPATSASWASTTSRRPPSSRRRSRRCARTSPSSDGRASTCCSMRSHATRARRRGSPWRPS